jgi:hypothetical protein
MLFYFTFKLLTINWVLSYLSSKLKNKTNRFLLKIAFSVWNTPHGRPRGIYNNPLLNYLHQKLANVWLEQATQIKASMGISREKNDKIDSQKIGLYAYKNREDVRLWTPKRPVVVQLDRLTALRERLAECRPVKVSKF